MVLVRPHRHGSEASISKIYENYDVAISPNGNRIVVLNITSCLLKLYKANDLSKVCKEINYDSKLKLNSRSLTVSNEFTLADGTAEVLIAMSCFDDNDMKLKDNKRRTHSNELSSAEEADVNVNDQDKSSTFIFSTARQVKIDSPINDMGGIIKFLDTKDDDDKTEVVLINALGITKAFINHVEGVNDKKSSILSFICPAKPIEEFNFPKKFSKEIIRLSGNETCTSLIQRNLVKDRFVIESYKDKVQSIEMYNLKTTSLENTFQKREEIAASVVGKGVPFFAISKNETLFAYCRGTNSITIYLMENGLEVTTKKFKEKNVIRILSFDFIQEDSKLLIFIEEEGNNPNYSPVIVVWGLFSCSYNCVERITDISSIYSFKYDYYQRLIVSDNLIFIDNDGNIFSTIEISEINKLMNPENNNTRKIISLDKSREIANTSKSTNTAKSLPLSVADNHLVYNVSGNRLDFEDENDIIIVNDPEPWVHNTYYYRTTIYLDAEGETQLIIGESTVQVWLKRKGISKPKRILQYIWTNPFKEMHRQMQILSLEVAYKEFSLIIYIPSGDSPTQPGQQVTIEWPDKVNVPVDACQSLKFLEQLRNKPSGPKKQHIFENLVQQTENIIKKYFVKRCGLWRMLDIRYDLMSHLIHGNRVSIIRSILSFKSANGKNKNLHIPRLHSWDGRVKETDLEIAIKHTRGAYRKDTVVVKYLLDYYSDNATKTSNWMFTVTKAIPLLYEYKLAYYVKELFQKPCFGSNEVYLERSKLDIKDINRSQQKNIHALNINTGLIKRNEHCFLKQMIYRDKPSKKTKNSKNIKNIDQVYMVPLPDFTVYPDGIHDERKYWGLPIASLKYLFWPRSHVIKQEEKLSPFLRMIRYDYTTEIYDNPSMAAVIDYKWSKAKKYFTMQALTRLVFGASYAILSNSIHGLGEIDRSNTFFVFVAVFYWLGFYLLNTERVQLQYEGWRRYFSVYNFFDLFSILLPYAAATLQVYYCLSAYSKDVDIIGNYFNMDGKFFTIFNSFTVLIMWIEAFLLLRYLEKTGAYIYIVMNIVKQITSFLIFILLVVLGFGHTMFVLLSNTDRINVIPDGSNFKIYDNNKEPTPGLNNLEINQEFDVNSTSDNYYTNIFKSIEAVYFWTNGRWDQLDQWNFWPVDVFSIIASILLVTILQNMLIAIMAKSAVLKYRAELIEDYETLSNPIGNRKEDPRYIYFIGKSKYIKKWLEKSEKEIERNKIFLGEIDGGNPWSYDDSDEQERFQNFQNSHHHSRSYNIVLQYMEQEFSERLRFIEDSVRQLLQNQQNQRNVDIN
ncbi:15993_t:CDS:2 [Funneliformis mosseae]|uniref:15993_t:CDS:1 n=1 Tax=Funneliformis mosseae TaxID=27381 RepID=A0A9N9BWX4_FUNMO|nr:15993_t:CDS:2 [Funneliformis mosseae]